MQYGISDMDPTTGQGFHLYDPLNPPKERVPDLTIALKPRFQQVAYADTAEGTMRAQEEDTGLSIPWYPENLDMTVTGNHGTPLTQHVPFVLHGPGIKQGYTSESRVETIDIVPSICRINGWYKPNGAQGKELDCIVQVDTFWYPDLLDNSHEHNEWNLQYSSPTGSDNTIYLKLPESGTPSTSDGVEILSSSIDMNGVSYIDSDELYEITPSGDNYNDGLGAIAVYNGRLYVGWVQQAGQNRVLIRSYDGTSWSSITEITEGIQSKLWDLEVYNGKLYAIMQSWTDTDLAIMVKSYDGTSWSSATKITPHGAYGYNDAPRMVVYDNNLYAVWVTTMEAISTGSDKDIVIRSYNGASWGTTIELSQTVALYDDNWPHLAVYNSELYVTWYTYTDELGGWGPPNIVYRVYDGSTWDGISYISSGFNDKYPYLVVYDGELYITWRRVGITNGNDVWIVARSYDGSSWGADIEISPIGDSLYEFLPSMYVYNNMLNVVWSRYTGLGSDSEVVIRTFNGASWGFSQRISGVLQSAGGTVMAEYNSDLYATFFTNDPSLTDGDDWDLLIGKIVYSSIPNDPSVDVGNDGITEWQYASGGLNTLVTINDLNTGPNNPSGPSPYTFSEAIQKYINTNNPIAGYYRVPVKITITSQGAIDLSNTHIVHTETLYDRIVNPENENCYATIQEAVDDANAGDLIYIYGGTYIENVVIPSSKSSITIMGEKNNRPIIDGGGTANVFTVHADSIVIKDVIISNGDFGIFLSGTADNNLIYSNAFIGNIVSAYDAKTTNEWHHGYPYGGNYWDDMDSHTAMVQDEFSGEKINGNQPQTGTSGPDGYNDYSYADGNVEDWYPLDASLILTQSFEYNDGDWIILGDETRIFNIIILNGDLSIPAGSSLTLLNTNLYIESFYDGEHTITIDGTLNLIGSTISSSSPDKMYKLDGTGNIVIKNSEIIDIHPDSSYGIGEDNIWYGDPINAFTTLNLQFPDGGNEEIAYFKLPKTAETLFIKIDLTGESIDSSYPINPIIDIGDDDIAEWSYSGELTTTETLYTPTFRISTQDYLDANQPDESGYLNIPVSFSTASKGELIISNIDVRYTSKWTTTIFSKDHFCSSCYLNKFTVDIHYTGMGGIRIDDDSCPDIKYHNSINEEDWGKPAVIKHHYPDENDDGIVDGTSIPEFTLKIYWWDENLQNWVEAADVFGEENTGVETQDNYVWTNADHFSNFTTKGSYIPIAETEELINTLDGMDIPEGIKNSLMTKLEMTLGYLNAAQNHFINGDIEMGNQNLSLAKDKLDSFISQVVAQSGKAIRNEDADILINDAQEIIDMIEEAIV
jgi:hypothetical protein